MASIEISNVQANAACWAPGETASIQFTLTNGSGVALTRLALAFVLDERDFTGATSGSYALIDLGYAAGTSSLEGEVVNLANGASRTFSASFEINETVAGYFADHSAVRAVPLYLSYSATEQSIGGIVELSGLHAINCRYAPLIAAFSLERAEDGLPSDEGENVLLTALLAMAGEDTASFLGAQLYYAQGAAADTSCACIDLSGSIAQMIAGVSDDEQLISQTFSNGSDWDFLLVFGDAYESCALHCSLGRAFANLHLSGASTGGACFGGFSASSEGDPWLECRYPARFYAGIQGVTNYVSGETATGGTWIDGKPVYRYVLSATASISGGQQIVGTLPSAIGALIHACGAMTSQDGSARPLPYAIFSGTTWTAGYMLTASGDIYLQLGSSYSGVHNVVIVLEYTRAEEAA